MRAITTIAEVMKLNLDRSNMDWSLWEHWNHGKVMVEDRPDGEVVWLNVHGYKAGGK